MTKTEETQEAVAELLSFLQTRHPDPVRALLVLTFAVATMVGVTSGWPKRVSMRLILAIRAAMTIAWQVYDMLSKHHRLTERG